jgi:hypothetical protein
MVEQAGNRFESHVTSTLAGSHVEYRKTAETANAFGAAATTLGGLLAICWQPASQQDSRKAFVLVGVTGFEPVTSAV